MTAASVLLAVSAALLTFTDGDASIDDARPDVSSVRVPVVRPGQALATGQGRAELLMAMKHFIRLAPDSRLEFGASG